MRKTISSLFILSLLLLSLWGLSSWMYGSATKESLKAYLSADKSNFNNSLFKGLNYDVLESSFTIFGAKLKLSIKTDEENIFNKLMQGLDDELIINIDIVNGPILFEKTSVSLGKSIWRVVVDEELDESRLLSKLSLNQFLKATIKVGFDNVLDYRLPIESALNQLIISGTFDPSTSIGQGTLNGNHLKYKSENQEIDIKQLQISYKHQKMSSVKTQLDWSTAIPEILFKHQLMSKPLALELIGKSTTSFHLDKLSALNTFNFKQKRVSDYPAESGEITFNITDGSISRLFNVMDSFNKITELQNQTQWILEEQSEVPEGQDQIWQLQDNIEQATAELPQLTNELLVNNNKNVVNFTLATKYQNNRSSLIGSVLPLSQQSLRKADLSSGDSFLSLFKFVSKVNLGDSFLAYISTKLPIKKSQFDLIYKQNKLLMQ